jgi:acyl-CoA thioesterase
MVFTSGFGGKTICRSLTHLQQIIERESFLASLFAPFDYQTDNFNQK